MADELPSAAGQPGGGDPASPLPGNQPPPEQQTPFRREYDAPFKRVGGGQQLTKGSLLIAKYDFWKHDPYPLVLVSGIYRDQRVAGVNLHYLTSRDMINLLKQHCNKNTMSYQAIKAGATKQVRKNPVVAAFRTYRRAGLRQMRLLDCDFVLNALGAARASYNPSEIEKIRQYLQQRVRQGVNPKSDDMLRAAREPLVPHRGGIPPTPAQPASVPAQPITPTGPNQ